MIVKNFTFEKKRRRIFIIKILKYYIQDFSIITNKITHKNKYITEVSKNIFNKKTSEYDIYLIVRVKS